MSVALILDAEAVASLADRRSASFREVQAALEAARRLRRDVVVPAVVLAELYRGPRRSQVVDSLLSRQAWITIRDTDRDFARYVGAVLVAAGADSDDIADAHVVAAGVEAGRALILTGDEADLTRLAASYPNLVVAPI